MSSAAVYFLFSEMPNLSFKNGIIFSGSQQTELGTNLLKKKKTRKKQQGEGKGHLELMTVLFMQGHHQVKFQFTVKEGLHDKMQIKWNLLSETDKIKIPPPSP